MGNLKPPLADEQLNMLYLKNRELIEALKNLRRKLGGKDNDSPVDLTVEVECEEPETKEENK